MSKIIIEGIDSPTFLAVLDVELSPVMSLTTIFAKTAYLFYHVSFFH
ncbi:hypothetical protein [Viridibacillus arvi]